MYRNYQEQTEALRQGFSGDPHFRFKSTRIIPVENDSIEIPDLPYWWDGGRYWVQTNAGHLNTALLCDTQSAAAAKDWGDFIAAVAEAKRLSAEDHK